MGAQRALAFIVEERLSATRRGLYKVIPMNHSPGGIPITTRRLAMHKIITMGGGSVGLSAFALSEYNITPHQHYSVVSPTRLTEKIMTFSGPFDRGGQAMDLTLHRKITRDEISRALARINLLNEFFSDVGARFESGVETLIPLFDGLQVGFRKVDLKTTGTVCIFEQEDARCEFVSASPAEMTDLRDGLGKILGL
jgi:hypothetical protein